MEHTAFMALDAPSNNVAYADTASAITAGSSSFAAVNIDRGSEARRFLFSAAHHGSRQDASLGSFPGKFAWIAVVLFVLSVLIAVIG